MIDEKFGFQDFVDGKHLLEKKKGKKSKKKKKGGGLSDSWFTDGTPSGSSGAGIPVGTGGMGESLISELFAGITPAAFSDNMNSVSQYSNNDNDPEAGMSTLPPESRIPPEDGEEEAEMNLVDQARQLFQTMVHRPDANRATILNAFQELGVTESTAVSYYTRFLEEFGMTSDDVGQEMPGGAGGGFGDDIEGQEQTPYGEPEPLPDDSELEEPKDPNRAGFVRHVDNAHLVYKRQDDNGTFEELWVYNLHANSTDELEIRRDILAGTDIPPQKTRSPDGVQKYVTTSMGNAQMVHITGLPN